MALVAELIVVELRIDVIGKMSRVKATPQGGLECPANLTRTGVLTYHRADGSVQRELRHPDEVFKADHVASLAGAPLTIGHHGVVTPANWKQVAVGHVRDDVHQDGKFVVANVVIQDAEAVRSVQAGELVELSCGYMADIEHVAGEYLGERYDAKQVNLRGNHVALLPANQGRAGSDVRLRMDSAAWSDATTTDMELTEALAEIDRLNGVLAGEKARADALDTQVKAIDVDELVKDRLALYEDARTVLGDETKFDGRKDLDVKVETCTKAFPDLKLDGKPEQYIDGLFEAAVSQARQSAANVAKGNTRVDSTSIADQVADARKRNEERSKDAWKGKRKGGV